MLACAFNCWHSFPKSLSSQLVVLQGQHWTPCNFCWFHNNMQLLCCLTRFWVLWPTPCFCFKTVCSCVANSNDPDQEATALKWMGARRCLCRHSFKIQCSLKQERLLDFYFLKCHISATNWVYFKGKLIKDNARMGIMPTHTDKLIWKSRY